MDAEDTNLVTFDNGLRLVTRNFPGATKTFIRINLDAGSRDEIPGNYPRGTSHFVEHMVFRGSRKNASGQVEKTIAKLGGNTAGAATDWDAVVFQAMIPNNGKNELPLALNALGDAISHPCFGPFEIDRERAPIKLEWLDGQLDPDKKRFLDIVNASSRGAAQVSPILGDLNSIDQIKQDDLVRFHRNKYLTGNTVVAIDSDFSRYGDPTPMVRNAIDLPPGRRINMQPAQYTGGDERHSEIIPGMRVGLGFVLPPITDIKATAVSDVLSTLLNGIGEQSLYEELRMKKGLIYKVKVIENTSSDYNLLQISFNTFPQNVRASLETISGQLKALTEYVDADALEEAKKVTNDNYWATANNNPITRKMANDVMAHGRVIPHAHICELEQAVTVNDIREAAAALLKKPSTFVASGNDWSHVPRPEEIQQMFQIAAPELSRRPVSEAVRQGGFLPQPAWALHNHATARL